MSKQVLPLIIKAHHALSLLKYQSNLKHHFSTGVVADIFLKNHLYIVSVKSVKFHDRSGSVKFKAKMWVSICVLYLPVSCMSNYHSLTKKKPYFMMGEISQLLTILRATSIERQLQIYNKNSKRDSDGNLSYGNAFNEHCTGEGVIAVVHILRLSGM